MKKILFFYLLITTCHTHTSIVPSWASTTDVYDTIDSDNESSHIWFWGTVAAGGIAGTYYLWNHFFHRREPLSIDHNPMHSPDLIETRNRILNQLNDKTYGEKLYLAHFVLLIKQAITPDCSYNAIILDVGSRRNILVIIDEKAVETYFDNLSMEEIEKVLNKNIKNLDTPFLNELLNLPETFQLTLENIPQLLEQACREHR